MTEEKTNQQQTQQQEGQQAGTQAQGSQSQQSGAKQLEADKRNVGSFGGTYSHRDHRHGTGADLRPGHERSVKGREA